MAQDWNKITMKYIASLENLQEAQYWAYKSGIDSGRYKRINPLDIIPVEELSNGKILISELTRKYNVVAPKIRKYRRDNGIHTRRFNPISVVPLDQLNNHSISINWLVSNYNVSYASVRKYRNTNAIKFIPRYVNGRWQEGSLEK